jgi:hypothetical protein
VRPGVSLVIAGRDDAGAKHYQETQLRRATQALSELDKG